MSTQNKTQLDKFKEVARQLETDDDEDRFEERLKSLIDREKVKEKLDDRSGD